MENPFRGVTPNKTGISSIKSNKVKLIATTPLLSIRLKTLILLQSKDILPIFGLTQEELNEYKDNFFNIDSILTMGRPYILAYLESTQQKDLLKYYLGGESYAKAKLGLADSINQGEIYSKIIDDALVRSLDSSDIDTKLKCIKAIKVTGNTETVVDKLSEILKDQDI